MGPYPGAPPGGREEGATRAERRVSADQGELGPTAQGRQGWQEATGQPPVVVVEEGDELASSSTRGLVPRGGGGPASTIDRVNLDLQPIPAVPRHRLYRGECSLQRDAAAGGGDDHID